MAKPGRKSANELAIIRRSGGRKSDPDEACVFSLGKRPPPPLSLGLRAADEWRRVVDAMASDWFRPETLSLLQAYCEHVAEREVVQGMLEKVRPSALQDDESRKCYHDLLKALKMQTSMMLSCATKMRLTQQAGYTPQAAGTSRKNASMARPWDV